MKAPAAVAALAIAITSSALGAERLDCRYYRADEANPATMAEDPGPLEGLLLPDNDVFRPILADQREPRFYADYRRVHFRFSNSELLAEGKGPNINAGMVGLGGEFGSWGLRQPRGCDVLHVSLFGVVLPLFDRDTPSADLLNADYWVVPTQAD